MSDVVIHAEKISKMYRLGAIGSGTFAYDVSRAWNKILGREGDENSGEDLWALKEVSFEVKQGEVLGIIGKNGAGKSTLLKILSQITQPTSGEIRIKGKIASLLEVGTGFHPELTGRENIFLNGAILGMRKQEIKNKFDEIVDFSGVEKFIDTPVKRYSSGMYVRLAFAVAAHLEPEILIVDEVLAVGDAEFQTKCLGKMKNVAGMGRTVLFVSHNLAAVQSLCSRGILLGNGIIKKEGPTSEVIQYYFNMGINKKEKPPIEKYRDYDIRNAPVYIKDIYVKGSQSEIPIIPMNQTPVIVITIIAKKKIENASVALVLYNAEGIKTDVAFSWDDNFYLNIDEGTHEIEFLQKHFSLPPDQYTIGVGLNQSYNTNAWDGINYYPIFKIENHNNVLHWDFRPWAVHHSQSNNWKLASKS